MNTRPAKNAGGTSHSCRRCLLEPAMVMVGGSFFESASGIMTEMTADVTWYLQKIHVPSSSFKMASVWWLLVPCRCSVNISSPSFNHDARHLYSPLCTSDGNKCLSYRSVNDETTRAHRIFISTCSVKQSLSLQHENTIVHEQSSYFCEQ